MNPPIVIGLISRRRADRLIQMIGELPLELGGVAPTMDGLVDVLGRVTVRGLIVGAPDHVAFHQRATHVLEGRPVPVLGVLETNNSAPANVWRWMERTHSRTCHGSLLDRDDAGASKTIRELLKFFCRASTPTRDLSRSFMDLSEVLDDLDDL